MNGSVAVRRSGVATKKHSPFGGRKIKKCALFFEDTKRFSVCVI